MSRFNTQEVGVAVITPTQSDKGLCFRDITLADLPQINRLLQLSDSRTCDYTIGGIFMWIKYFSYQYCIYRDTLFIKGKSESDLSRTAFSLPVGKLPIREAIALLKDYCTENSIPLRFSAIPEDRLGDFHDIGLIDTEQLTDWADYLYEAQSLASFAGKKLSKKRNHVNRFTADNPGYFLAPVTTRASHLLKQLCDQWTEPEELDSPTAVEEHNGVLEVLDNLICYPFEGAVLYADADTPVAFTLGEVIGDTLYVHIEKMRHDIPGSGETVCKLFAEQMLNKYPSIKYINREEDTGDPGLRKAKLSYHPVMLLRKYDIIV